MTGTSSRGKNIATALLLLASAAGLYSSRLVSYLLFHSVAEIFSVVVACGVFMVSWNFRDSPDSRSLVYLGIGYLFTAVLDVFHLLTYQGMGVLPQYRDYATKLWLAARYLQTATLLRFVFSLHGRLVIPYRALFAAFGGAALLFILLILYWDLFPTAFVEGVGLTPFKRISEYAISTLLAVSLAVLLRERPWDPPTRRLLAASIAVTIASELLFTLYTQAYGTANMLGHYFKIGAYLLAYQALIAQQVRRRLALIDELQAARSDLQAKERALLDAGAAKDRFLSILGHDLRNPLSGVQTVAELLVNRYDDLGDEERRKFAGLVLEGSRQSLELLHSLLMWIRSQTGRMPHKPDLIDLHSSAEETISLVHGLAERKQITLASSVSRGTQAFADANMVLTVLRNLVTNAVKFTPRGGQVELSVEASDGQVAISVTDSGVGIEAANLAKLFRIDEHLSDRGTEEEAGSGLGLILCKELVEKNGGRIWARSTRGEGSRFTFTLPCEAPAAAQEIPESATPKD